MIRTVVEGHIEAICDTVHCAGSDVGRGSPEHRLHPEWPGRAQTGSPVRDQKVSTAGAHS
jgi:hypothetical protein